MFFAVLIESTTVFLLSCSARVDGYSGFIASFQSTGTINTEEWILLKGDMPRLEEFTTCHWEYLR